jgi:hypothetical protein
MNYTTFSNNSITFILLSLLTFTSQQISYKKNINKMNVASIVPQTEVRKLTSNQLKQRVIDYKKDNQYLDKMTGYIETKAQLVGEVITAERIR